MEKGRVDFDNHKKNQSSNEVDKYNSQLWSTVRAEIPNPIFPYFRKETKNKEAAMKNNISLTQIEPPGSYSLQRFHSPTIVGSSQRSQIGSAALHMLDPLGKVPIPHST